MTFSVFCGDAADGTMTAHDANSALVGQSLRDLKDKAGKPFGEEFYSVAAEGEYNVVEYVWPRPGETEPSPKTVEHRQGRQSGLRCGLLQVTGAFRTWRGHGQLSAGWRRRIGPRSREAPRGVSPTS